MCHMNYDITPLKNDGFEIFYRIIVIINWKIQNLIHYRKLQVQIGRPNFSKKKVKKKNSNKRDWEKK
jgi:hypothetical protein